MRVGISDTAPPFTMLENQRPVLPAPVDKQLGRWVHDCAHAEAENSPVQNHQRKKDQVDVNQDLDQRAAAQRIEAEDLSGFAVGVHKATPPLISVFFTLSRAASTLPKKGFSASPKRQTCQSMNR